MTLKMLRAQAEFQLQTRDFPEEIIRPIVETMECQREIRNMKEESRKTKMLISTSNGKTFMINSLEPKTLVIFENPVKQVDGNGNTVLYYSSIKIQKM